MRDFRKWTIGSTGLWCVKENTHTQRRRDTNEASITIPGLGIISQYGTERKNPSGAQLSRWAEDEKTEFGVNSKHVSLNLISL